MRKEELFGKLPLAWQEKAPWEPDARVEYLESLGYKVWSIGRAVRIVIPSVATGKDGLLDSVVEIDLINLVTVFTVVFQLDDLISFLQELQSALKADHGRAAFTPPTHEFSCVVELRQNFASINGKIEWPNSEVCEVTFKLVSSKMELQAMFTTLEEIVRHYYGGDSLRG